MSLLQTSLLFSTPHNISENERTSTITDEDKSRIKMMFKDEYSQQIYIWALMSCKSKQKTFFDMLDGEQQQSRMKERGVEKLNFSIRVPDLVIRKANCQIDINRSWIGTPHSKQTNPNKFASPGTDEVFNHTPLRSVPEQKSTLSQFIVKKIMKPNHASKVCQYADDYYNLLHELLNVIEKKVNFLPIDTLYNHETLSPRSARVTNTKKMGEDHLDDIINSNKHNHMHSPPLTSRSITNHPRFEIKTGMTTTQDSYSPELRRGIDTRPPVLIRPTEQKQSFASFPSLNEPIVYVKNELIMKQSSTNTETGRKYKSIFESETCL
ncbi:hypothetical protein TRFO_36215 [Tritrichomonas foetus]|uniref:Uncharacterized protein n=1 Tax=Tritrichomonas foetus TaxID=1144522 RepID=A0A1J4JFX9_9EUKA|nr:hypothetical protein TRFO_36215 [Tritrichomonas foetus]|eukprot:OHS97561.1 hypothetical protein TRFO_36215 [Tritrichomonas foetus]